jgi:hypothetical protein
VSYEVFFREPVIRLIEVWAPPESALDELERFVNERLAVDPAGCLVRVGEGGGMQCACSAVEPGSGRVHVFLLRVHYGEDEKTLFVYEAFYYPFEA